MDGLVLSQQSIAARIERLPFSPWHIYVRVIIGFATFFDGFDVLATTFVVPVLIPLWKLSSQQIGLLISASFAGQLVGALLCGWFAERFGRLRTLIVATAIFSLMSIVCAFSWSFASLASFKFIQGVGLGGEVPVATSYISEIARSKGRGRFFILYEMEAYETLSSPGYLARLNAPSPWSTKMMPHHRNMVRSQCRVLESIGGALSRHALTVRLSPAEGADEKLRAHLGDLAVAIRSSAGTAAGHLLQTETPKIAATTEQKIRGGKDAAADWVFVACGYDRAALDALAANELGEAALVAAGARTGAIRGIYTLSHTNVAGDVA